MERMFGKLKEDLGAEVELVEKKIEDEYSKQKQLIEDQKCEVLNQFKATRVRESGRNINFSLVAIEILTQVSIFRKFIGGCDSRSNW
mmetsp:Transcript_9368/g.16888  ORF Transcript_9368/g.16888 Transcript_9368/m.16888 type:complete len:87 (-) Transcript_9368:1568-1828(-)